MPQTGSSALWEVVSMAGSAPDYVMGRQGFCRKKRRLDRMAARPGVRWTPAAASGRCKSAKPRGPNPARREDQAMAESKVTFMSAGRKLAGVVRVPDGVKPGERRPAWIVMHGFGSNMTSSNVLLPCKMFEDLGYVTMRIDM